ncbi:hypothetical protein DSO57_1002844 [Entomophthora muscae]|uniref:Uncharacterized protein n=1 Tax=Entomophthora muscae TaxID=34485 RepID=A0ACC2RZM5_9FUNG|nr:hypothetical protein DSO57_1002844 [Entomophthora muscae]
MQKLENLPYRFPSSPGSDSSDAYSTPQERKAILDFLSEYNHEFPILSSPNIHQLLSTPETYYSHQLKDYICLVSGMRPEFREPLRQALASACLLYIDQSDTLVPDGPYFMARFIMAHAIAKIYTGFNLTS